jgi:hypothetical protein
MEKEDAPGKGPDGSQVALMGYLLATQLTCRLREEIWKTADFNHRLIRRITVQTEKGKTIQGSGELVISPQEKGAPHGHQNPCGLPGFIEKASSKRL